MSLQLEMIKELKCYFYLFSEFRSVILSITCKHLRIHFLRKEEINMCCSVTSVMLSKLYEQKAMNRKETSIFDNDINLMCKTLLQVFMQTIIDLFDGSNPILSTLVSVTLGLIQILEESNYKCFWDELIAESDDLCNMKQFLFKSFLVFKELLSQNWSVFTNDWFIMKIASNSVIRKCLEEFSKPLVYTFLQNDTFDVELWREYFNVVVSYVTQRSLQLEKYPDNKSRKILKMYGDMRVTMGFQVLSMWFQLGNKKSNFIPSMVGPILEITLVPETSLRKSTIEVFYDMIQCEEVILGVEKSAITKFFKILVK